VEALTGLLEGGSECTKADFYQKLPYFLKNRVSLRLTSKLRDLVTCKMKKNLLMW
jgi:hypothetical protein